MLLIVMISAKTIHTFLPSLMPLRLLKNAASRNNASKLYEKDPGSSSFDSDFAEAMSKPLPDWYLEDKAKKEQLLQELQENRNRIMLEFKAKYELSEEEKAKELKEKWDRIDANLAKSDSDPWYYKMIGVKKSKDKATMTKEKWESIWAESDKDKDPDNLFPGFFEVFPELLLKWPKWTRNKDGKTRRCRTDSDCPIPQSCCQHPIFAGENFCCTGWGRRKMVPQYCPQEIIAQQGPRGGTDARDPPDKSKQKRSWQQE